MSLLRKQTLRAKSLADVRNVDHLNEDCWNEVLRKRRNRPHLWRQGSQYLGHGDSGAGGGDAIQELVVKEVSSMRSIVDATGKSKDARYRSGIALNAVTLTLADEESDSEDNSDNDSCDNEDAVHANGNGEQNGTKNGTTITADKNRKIHLLIEAPESASVLGSSAGFARESFWYSSALPALSRRHAVLRSLFPTCIHGSADIGGSAKPVVAKWKIPEGLLLKNRGVLIFEDPLMDDFKALDPMVSLSFSHVKLVLEALAHFHGSWWQLLNAEGAFRYKRSTLTVSDVDAVCNEDTVDSAELRSAAKVRPKEIARVLREYKANPQEEISDELEKAAKRCETSNLMKRVRQHLKSGKTSKLATICHGDLRTGNVLFRSDGVNAPLAAKISSFAAMYRGHPADDIAHFLYSSTSKAFRDIYEDLCLRTYFSIFKDYVGCKMDELTFEEFKTECERRRELGIIRSILSLPDILNPKDIAEQEERQAADRTISEKLSKLATTARRGSRSPWSFHPPPETQENNPMVKQMRGWMAGLARDIVQLDLLNDEEEKKKAKKKAVEEEEKRAAEAKAEKEKFRAAVEEKNAKATEEDVN